MQKSLPDKRGHFGIFGGKYVPETLMTPLKELEEAYLSARKDILFQKEMRFLFERLCRKANPSLLRKETNRRVERGEDLSQARRLDPYRIS